MPGGKRRANGNQLRNYINRRSIHNHNQSISNNTLVRSRNIDNANNDSRRNNHNHISIGSATSHAGKDTTNFGLASSWGNVNQYGKSLGSQGGAGSEPVKGNKTNTS